MYPDNYDMWLDHELDLERDREHLPKCRCCGDYIYDDYFYVEGVILCEECMNYKYRRSADDYYG